MLHRLAASATAARGVVERAQPQLGVCIESVIHRRYALRNGPFRRRRLWRCPPVGIRRRSWCTYRCICPAPCSRRLRTLWTLTSGRDTDLFDSWRFIALLLFMESTIHRDQ